MKKLFILIASSLYSLAAFCQQKPIVDTAMLGTWPEPEKDGTLSKNGRYAAFSLRNLPTGKYTLIMQDVCGSWKKKFISKQPFDEFYFSDDSKWLCIKKEDSLLLQSTGEEQGISLRVDLYIRPRLSKGEWIVFSKNANEGNLVLMNLSTKKTTSYLNAFEAYFDDAGKILLLNCKDEQGNYKLLWVDLRLQKSKVIWTGHKNITGYQFDKAAKQVAFLAVDSLSAAVYYYNNAMTIALERLNEKDLDSQLIIDRVSGFSENDKWLFLRLRNQKEKVPFRNPKMVSVDVWTYKDEVLYPEQSITPLKTRTLDIVLNPKSKESPIFLNPDGVTTGLSPGATRLVKGDYLMLTSDTNDSREYWWPHSPEPQSWLISLAGGIRKQLPFHDLSAKISPSGRWMVFWNKGKSRFDYYTYEIATGKITNITNKLPASVAMEYQVKVDSIPVGIAGWFKNDEAILIYDNYDIWKIDPSGEESPVNLTNGFGLRNSIKLRFLNNESNGIEWHSYQGDELLLLSGFNEMTKFNGFLKLDLKVRKDPEVLTMSPFSWYKQRSQISNSAATSNLLMCPVEAGTWKNHGWILMGESATEFPNYYYTKNLKKFVPLTDFSPQKKFNWLTTELVSWKMLDGKMSQGILYKPENFDSAKKYPIIFNYYERYSGYLYSFLYPMFTNGSINIPWFVSRGYLVFTPDIHFSVGAKTGISNCEHAYNSIVSAAEYLAKLPYVDENRMAIQGHSFGGLLTNYFLTHSKLFAAAAEAAGFSDEMSSYLTLAGNRINPFDNKSVQSHKETDHGLYGGTPWDYPELYRNNSPVWDADKATAPLLILHNKKDEQVQWRQGVEMFMALRRLGKPCWMLQYDNSYHSAIGNDAKDYTIRLTQYFDHYLKNMPAPRWMTQGIPAKLKQVEIRFELDPSGNCSKDCKVCKMWNEKIKMDSSATLKEISNISKGISYGVVNN